MLEEFRLLPIWKRMVATSGEQDVENLERHLIHILPRMEHYVDTFPTYTLHNKLHVYNVVKLMGSLLGNEVEKLEGLEAFILILSAAYHDYGMVYNEAEREKISGDRKFHEEFLGNLPSARVHFEESGRKLTKDLAEWYCRWAHAERVWTKLEETEGVCGQVLWNGIPIRHQIGHVCESHNEPAENIRTDDDRFVPDFLKVCDLRFCAMLLRLADILDFDNSRSPQSVYDFLDLGNPKNKAEKISKDEWDKHMASKGFEFPQQPTTKPLFFKAVPPHPYIEQGIRKFLNLIDLELTGALKVSRLCNDRWQGFPFPEKIDRAGIVSTDYCTGSYRFHLSEDKILDLLTGDDLYSDDFIFIRELLQNSIDTVRHRTFIEKFDHPDYKPNPIEVSFFKDDEGYYWLRVDDQGMGMSQEIITSFLLDKGNSYYNSDLFKLEKIMIWEKNQEDFVPISRFGIGLLSCFMMCDKIEINTAYFYPMPGKGLNRTRLTVEGRSGFWVIRSEQMHHKPTKMPSREGGEDGYREAPGTSIACRIKTSKEFHGLNIAEQIERFLLAPEVPVIFEEKLMGGDRDELANKPWCTYSRTALPEEFLERCRALLQLNVKRIEIEVRPIDLTKNSGTKNLSGQLVLVVPRIEVADVHKGFNSEPFFSITQGQEGFKFICTKKGKDEKGNEIRSEEVYDIKSIIDTIKFPEKFVEDERGYPFRWPRVSHNGIVLYDNEQQLQGVLNDFDQYHDYSRHHRFYLATGLFCFRDNLLPDVTVSRSVIKSISPEIITNIMYATRELNEYAKSPFRLFGYFPNIERSKSRYTHYSVEAFERTGIYEKAPDFWHSLPSLATKENVITINEALELLKQGPIAFRPISNCGAFYTQFSKFLLSKTLAIKYVDNNGDYYLEGVVPDNAQNPGSELGNFEPMTFLNGDDDTKVVLRNGSLNLTHPLIKWYLTWNHLIKKEFYYFGIQLKNQLLGDSKIDEKINEVNEILGRLRILLPEPARPSKEISVEQNSFYPKN